MWRGVFPIEQMRPQRVQVLFWFVGVFGEGCANGRGEVVLF
jgi:hypothetical protein